MKMRKQTKKPASRKKATSEVVSRQASSDTIQRKKAKRLASNHGKTNGSTGKVDSEMVMKFAAEKGYFSSKEVSDHFGIPMTNVAANIAILSMKSLVKKLGKDVDGSSAWEYTG